MSNVDVAIIGGGPAGSQCGLWLKMMGYNPIILEKQSKLGGVLHSTPNENHWIVCAPGATGPELGRSIDACVKRYNVPHLLDVRDIEIDNSDRGFVLRCQLEHETHLVNASYMVIATGVSPNTGGLMPSDRLLIGAGDVVDQADVKGKRVAILGGGDNAFEYYGILHDMGADHVQIFARHIRARKNFVDIVPKDHVYVGDYEVDASNICVVNQPFDMMCVMYGWHANNPIANSVELDMEDGFIKTNADYQTSHPHIYAIGECTKRSHPCVVTAMADGVMVAKSIQQML